MIRIAAIVVTYNRKEKLRNCIEAILEQNASVQPDIFIVDNGSTDGTEKMLYSMAEECEGLKERLIYNNLRHNTGGAGGFNYGIRKAVESGYDYLWLMDDDSIASDSAVEELLKFGEEHKGEYGFLASKILWKDGSICRMSIQRETLTRNVTNWDRDIISIAMSSFVSCFIPRDVVAEIGLPIRDFFLWSDDWEYTRRISMVYPCYLVTSSTVVHDMEINSGADISTAPDAVLARYRKLYRNDVYIYRREGLRGFVYEVARLTVHTMRIVCSDLTRKDRIKRIGIIMKGTADGLRFHPVPERIVK